MQSAPPLRVDTAVSPAQYDLSPSPRTSISSAADVKPFILPTPAPAHPVKPIQPSLRLLFSLLSPRQCFLLLLPAVISSLVAGGIAPFMTYLIGQVFAAYAQYPLSGATQQDKDLLLHHVGIAALELVALAVGSLVLSSVTSSLWIWTGERNLLALRRRVYHAVTSKEMVWFDAKIGAQSESSEEQGPLGAGGLMAKFTR